ncbi:MAG TPA: Na+/H+ antiporter NhaA [Streptosporangiaceae bacterium]|nr:Na+/H+ antiporter NhaA [Streptosporangiaceae bacterium]
MSGVKIGVVGVTVGSWGSGALVWANVHLGSYTRRLQWREIAAVAIPAGVGFTVSLLIGGLAYQEPAQFERVATAVLIASLLASASVAFPIRVRRQACGDAG